LTTEIATQAAVVLELAQRRKDSEQLSLYADRDRIARDLHDLAIQRLFALSMSLEGAYKITEKPAVAKRLAQGIPVLDADRRTLGLVTTRDIARAAADASADEHPQWEE